MTQAREATLLTAELALHNQHVVSMCTGYGTGCCQGLLVCFV